MSTVSERTDTEKSKTPLFVDPEATTRVVTTTVVIEKTVPQSPTIENNKQLNGSTSTYKEEDETNM